MGVLLDRGISIKKVLKHTNRERKQLSPVDQKERTLLEYGETKYSSQMALRFGNFRSGRTFREKTQKNRGKKGKVR